jgi:AcrR family transcriptional regulator
MSDITSARDGSGGDAPSRARRADARRNIEAIVEAARATLAADPSAAMQDIAQSAGLHRATLHRHFPARDDLVDAVRARAIDDAAVAIAGLMSDGGQEPGPLLDGVISALLDIGDRYRLYRYTTWQDSSVDEQRSTEIAEPLRRLLETAQRAGEVRTDVPVDHLRAAAGGLLWGVLPEIAAGTMSHAEAVRFVRRMLSAPKS